MATILDLLMALNRGDLPPLPRPAPSAPIPYAPVPNLGPLSDETTAAFGALNPEPVPPRITAPSAPDANFINQYAGAAPTAPVLNDPTTLDKVAAILGGIAGGPGYASALREERERPIREYNAALERYQGRRAQGIELGERRAEREADRANRAAENQYEREFNVWVKKTGVRDAEAITRMRQAFDIQKIRERERIADEKQAAIEAKQLKLKAADLAKAYRLAGAPGAYPNELAQRDLGLRDNVSTGADNWLSSHVQLEQARANRLAGLGGGGGASAKAQKALGQFEAIKQKLIEAVATGSAQAQKQLMLDLNRSFRGLARFPEIEAGYDPSGRWPYAKIRTAQGSVGLVPQATAPQSRANDPLGIR